MRNISFFLNYIPSIYSEPRTLWWQFLYNLVILTFNYTKSTGLINFAFYSLNSILKLFLIICLKKQIPYFLINIYKIIPR